MVVGILILGFSTGFVITSSVCFLATVSVLGLVVITGFFATGGVFAGVLTGVFTAGFFVVTVGFVTFFGTGSFSIFLCGFVSVVFGVSGTGVSFTRGLSRKNGST